MPEPETLSQKYVGYPRGIDRDDSELQLLRGMRSARIGSILVSIVTLIYMVDHLWHPSRTFLISILEVTFCTAFNACVMFHFAKVLEGPKWKKSKSFWQALGIFVATSLFLGPFSRGDIFLFTWIPVVWRLDWHVQQRLRKLGYDPPTWFGLGRFLAAEIRSREATLALAAPMVPENLYSGEPPKV